MAKIFQQQKEMFQKPNRNNFDLSFDNNFTTKIGQLTPIMIKEVMPGDHFNIDTSIGLRAMPLAFPVQSRLQAHISFFYVPNRILWDNWRDFVSDTQEHVHPFLSIPFTRANEIGTGTLADYLGVPTTYATDSDTDWFFSSIFGFDDMNLSSTSSVLYGTTDYNLKQQDSDEEVVSITSGNSQSITQNVPSFKPIIITDYTGFVDNGVGRSVVGFFGSPASANASYFLRSDKITLPLPHVIDCINTSFSDTALTVNVIVCVGDTFNNSRIDRVIKFSYSNNNDGTARLTQLDQLDYNPSGSYFLVFDGFTVDADSQVHFLINSDLSVNAFGTSLRYRSTFVNTTDVSALSNPFVIQEGETLPDIKLNALPFRAYEAIYNSFYRNHTDVDPFIVNGVKHYNRFCTNLSDGADFTTPLSLRFVNYELDYLTSALLSPQFGEAPLVGVTAVGEFTFEDEQGQTFKVIPKLGDDGNTLTGIDSYQEGTPIGALQRLNNAIKYGISISDFRNVNSFQHFLENHLRRGLKYEDVVKSHFGTDMRYNSVDEPQYIGGFTRTIDVTQITATAQSDGIRLGDYVGQAGLFGKSKHSINHYVDENGFIIGLLSIVPIPTYSQLLPKMFLKDNLLSYPFPLEFRHIGLQPIDYREVTPIQAKMHSKPFTDTFGYQRPYYDFIASVDENHSNFRTDMQGYVFTRNFAEPPELGREFITVNPAQMTNPFIDVSPDSNTFIGQIHFDIKAKRPLARIHTSLIV